jgi:DNA-binding MarR family transcriptional regulator
MLKYLKLNQITAILITIITLLFLTSNFLMIEYIKDQKRGQKINIEELEVLNKTQIIEYIKEKQESSKPLVFLDYIYLMMIVTSYLSGILTAYLFVKDRCKQTTVDIKTFRKNLLLAFPIKYRKVIEELVKSNGQEAQAVLRQKLGLDKVQMTRLMKRMEEEGFITIKRGTKTNFIELNEKLKELFGLRNSI